MENNNQPKWNVNEFQQTMKQRRQMARVQFDADCTQIDNEARTRKNARRNKLNEQLMDIAREEDAYLAKYEAWCHQRRADVHKAYQERKEMEGGKP